MKPHTLKNDSTNGERGFTLVETTIASLVMMVAALACASLFVFSVQNNTGGAERALAMAVAQQQLEQTRSIKFEDAALDAGTTTTTVKNGERNYTVKRTVVSETNADGGDKFLKRITITVTPQTGQNWIRSSVVLVTLRSTLSSGIYLVNQ